MREEEAEEMQRRVAFVKCWAARLLHASAVQVLSKCWAARLLPKCWPGLSKCWPSAVQARADFSQLSLLKYPTTGAYVYEPHRGWRTVSCTVARTVSRGRMGGTDSRAITPRAIQFQPIYYLIDSYKAHGQCLSVYPREFCLELNFYTVPCPHDLGLGALFVCRLCL